MAFQVGRLVADLGLNTRSFNRALDQARGRGDVFTRNFARNTKRLSRDMNALGQDMFRAITLPVAGLTFVTGRAALQFESSFAGIRKTVDGTEEQFQALKTSIRELAREKIPVPVNDLNRLGELGGQLNISRENMLGFIETVARAGDAISAMTQEDAALGFAQMTAIMGEAQHRISNMAAALVDLGNNSNTTEDKILDMSVRFANAGKFAKFTTSQVFGIATAVASVGVRAEAGGSAISRTIFEIGEAVELGGDRLKLFADVAGRSVEEFRQDWEDNAALAFVDFIEGLKRTADEGGSLAVVLNELGLNSIRVRQALLSSAAAGSLMREQIERSSRAFKENTAHVVESDKRYATHEKQLQQQVNRMNDVAITIGEKLLPPFVKLVETVADAVEAFSRLPESIQAGIIGFTLFSAGLAPVLIGGSAILRMLAGFGPVLITLGRNLTTVSLVPELLATNFKVAAGAAGGLTTALAGLSFGIGYMIGLKIRPWVNELLGLNEALGLIANQRDDLVEGLLGDPERLQRAVDQYFSLKRALELYGEEWRFVNTGTRENVELLIQLTSKATEVARQRRKEADEARKAAKEEAERRRLAEDTTRQTDEQVKATKSLIEGLEDELAQLKLSNLALLERELRQQNATAADHERARALQVAIDAEEARREKEQEAEAAEEQRRQSIEQTIEALEQQHAALIHSAEAVTLDALAKARAAPEEIAYAKSLQESIRLENMRREKEAQAEEIINRTFTARQKLIIEQAKLNALLREGFLSQEQYNEAIKDTKEKYFEAMIGGIKFAEMGVQAARSIQKAFADFLFDPFEDGLKGMVEGFAQAMRRMIAEALAAQLVRSLLGGLATVAGGVGAGAAGGAGGAAATPSVGGLGPFGFSVGGMVRGPGTTVSDSILARLSRGEFVLRAAAVKKFGQRFFEDLNALRFPAPMLPAYARGGIVGDSRPGGMGRDLEPMNVTYNIDARGADAGVEERIRVALADSENRSVQRAVVAVADRRRRGGSWAKAFSRNR